MKNTISLDFNQFLTVQTLLYDTGHTKNYDGDYYIYKKDFSDRVFYIQRLGENSYRYSFKDNTNSALLKEMES